VIVSARLPLALNSNIPGLAPEFLIKLTKDVESFSTSHRSSCHGSTSMSARLATGTPGIIGFMTI